MATMAGKFFYDGELKEGLTIERPETSHETIDVRVPGGVVSVPLMTFESMELTVTTSGDANDASEITAPGRHDIEFREVVRSKKIDEEYVLVKYFFEVLHKSSGGYSLAPGEDQEGSETFEIIRLRMNVAGKDKVLINKETGEYMVNGKDYASQWYSMLD